MNDVNVYVFKAGTDEIVGGAYSNNIGKDPLEDFTFINFSYFNTTEFDIVIASASGTLPGRIKYFLPASSGVFTLDTSTWSNSSTIYGHANSAGAIAVGAADYRTAPQFDGDSATLESFSSAGGTPILFDTVGNRLAVPELRQKPDIVGPDNVNTTFFSNAYADVENDGFLNFPGTSASAPHIAGLAALMLEANPNLTPLQIKEALTSTAIDMDDPFTPEFDVGFDYGTGYGFVNGMAAITKILSETLPPKVMNVTFCQAIDPTDPAYAMNQVTMGQQLRTVPVGRIDQIAVEFSEDVTVSASDMRFVGMTKAYVPTLHTTAGFSYDPQTFTAIWRFAEPIRAPYGDFYLLSLSDVIEDADNNPLDGDWTNPANYLTTNTTVSEFPSGDGTAGGHFNFVVTILPGDADRDLYVYLSDFNIVVNNFGVGTLFTQGNFDGILGTDPFVVGLYDLNLVTNSFGADFRISLWLLADLDHDGVVNAADRATLEANLGMANPTLADGDLDGDHDVDGNDLARLLAQLDLAFAMVA